MIEPRAWALEALAAIQAAVRSDPSITGGAQKRIEALFRQSQLNVLRHVLLVVQHRANQAPRLFQPMMTRLVDEFSDLSIAIADGRDIPDPQRVSLEPRG
jgi:hypothetical protein